MSCCFAQDDATDTTDESAVANAHHAEAAYVASLSHAHNMSQQLQMAMTQTTQTMTTYLDHIDKLNIQCASRLGADWRYASEDDLTPTLVRESMVAARDKLTSLCTFMCATNTTWSLAPSLEPGSSTYLENIQHVAKTYHEFQQDSSWDCLRHWYSWRTDMIIWCRSCI